MKKILITTGVVAGIFLISTLIFGAGGDNIIVDTFTDADSTTLTVHTPDTGDSWTNVYQTGGSGCGSTPTLQILSNALVPECLDGTTAGTAYLAEGAYPTSNDYQVQYTCTDCGTGDDYVSGIIRSSDVFDEAVGAIITYDLTPSSGDDWKISYPETPTQCIVRDYIDEGQIGQALGLDGVVVTLQAMSNIGGKNEFIGFVGDIGYLYYDVATGNFDSGKGGIGMGASPCATTGDLPSLGDHQKVDDFSIIDIGEFNTGWLDPTTNGEISNTWTSPANMYSSNNVDATVEAVGTLQDYGDFGASIGATDTVRGISVKVEGIGDTRWRDICIEVSQDNGSTWSANKCSRIWGDKGDQTIDDLRIYGDANELWGLTWTPTDVTDTDLRVRIEMNDEEASAGTTQIDHISVNVYYDEGIAVVIPPAEIVMKAGDITLKAGEAVAGSVTVNTTADVDDGVEKAGVWTDTGGIYTCGGTSGIFGGAVDSDCGFRFRNVTVPQGAIITSATLDIRAVSDVGSSFNLYGNDADDAALWTSEQPNAMVLTANATAWTGANGNKVSITATTIIQEIVDRAGWASGNSMKLVLYDTASGNDSSIQIYQHETSQGDAADLVITYTGDSASAITIK